MEPETIDLNGKCVLVSIFCGLWYNKKDIIKKYNINNVSSLYNLLLYGNEKYPSLINKLMERNDEINDVSNKMFEEITNNCSDLTNIDVRLQRYRDANLLEKVEKQIIYGNANFELVLFVGMYFNIRFNEIWHNGVEPIAFNYFSDYLITEPETIIDIHTSERHNGLRSYLHSYYKEDTENIEKKIKNILCLRNDMKEEMIEGITDFGDMSNEEFYEILDSFKNEFINNLV
jgi:hypothetical protein